MALVVEDGTGVATAESYVSLADFKSYRPRGGLSIPASATDSELEAALIRGSAAVDAIYGDRWPKNSVRMTPTQVFDWPRSYAWDKDWEPLVGVPTAIKGMTYEAALVEANNPGELSAKAEVGIKSDSVGSLQTVYAGSSSVRPYAYPAITAWGARLLRGGSTMGRS